MRQQKIVEAAGTGVVKPDNLVEVVDGNQIGAARRGMGSVVKRELAVFQLQVTVSDGVCMVHKFADDLGGIVDAEWNRLQPMGQINFSVDSVAQPKGMRRLLRVVKHPDHLTTIIHPKRLGVEPAGKLNGGDFAVVVNIAMGPAGRIGITSGNISAVVQR